MKGAVATAGSTSGPAGHDLEERDETADKHMSAGQVMELPHREDRRRR
jgi:hypothetical protein